MKTLLTGATGFLGGHILRSLVQAGEDVHILVRTGSNLSVLDDVRAKVTIHTHTGDTESLVQLMQQITPDCILHLAAYFVGEHAEKDVIPLVESNVLFTTQLAEAAARAGVRKFIHTGSAWEHTGPSHEQPCSLYSATKQACRLMLRYYADTAGLQVITLSLFDTYGPRDTRRKLFFLWNQCAATQTPLAMSPGEQQLDLVHADDVVAAFQAARALLLAADGPVFAEYAVSSGRLMRLRELADIYARIMGVRLPIEWGARPYRVREVMVPWREFTPLPGWQAQVSLEDGIARLAEEKRQSV